MVIAIQKGDSHPMSIDSVKINPSLLMMTDCHMLSLTGLIASVYTGLNVQKWDGWDGMDGYRLDL